MLPRTSPPGGEAKQPPPEPLQSVAATSAPVSSPSISLPKGGGAIRGMGEKFTTNPLTGTGSMTVPIATSPGRSDFGVQLALSYDSGSGNGPFGFGWSLALSAITRKTDKGLPRYLDDEESDVFILSGAEDLVPELEKDATGIVVLRNGKAVVVEQPRTVDIDGITHAYMVRRYRPRIEGLFARVERWTRSDGDVHWRSISRGNVLSIYGKDTNSRIVDSQDSRRIFSWLVCETRDDKGNAVVYEYKPDDSASVDLTRIHERNRGAFDDPRRGTNRYPKRICYGNRRPLLDVTGVRPPQLTQSHVAGADWMFEVVFDYGDHDVAAPAPRDDEATNAAGEPIHPWPQRPDPFSSYRSGFEVRTNRLCQRILMFHHFPDEIGVGADCLVQSTDLGYLHEAGQASDAPAYSMFVSLQQTGYERVDSVGYRSKSAPPLEFSYTRPVVQDAVHDVDRNSLENLPFGLDGESYQWIDLHGEGLPGILSEQAGAWFYKRNLSPLQIGDVATPSFGSIETVALAPSFARQGQFMDLAGDGQPDVVILDGSMPGLYEHGEAETWKPFRPFTSRLTRYFGDPSLRVIDLDGDGRADVLVSEEEEAFVWHQSLGEDGFGPARRSAQSVDEEQGPHLVFAEATQTIYLADLSGDGLTDLVRIRNGEICYWPNLGYGRFGAKVAMDNSPRFDSLTDFDPGRIRLADIDGSGTTDIIYLHRDGVRLYFNQSGNSWSAPRNLIAFPPVDDIASIMIVDLLGNGTACLVWSSSLPGDVRRPMRFVNLMGGSKPHLLVRVDNNLGAETVVQYAPSTAFYLRDQRDGRPWLTRLPFPVHVVERVEAIDHISHTSLVTRYAYHHGYFDGEEREFRGFGMVEQLDTEAFDADGSLGGDTPPVLTKSWSHTGAMVNPGSTREYYREPGLSDDEARSLLLADTILPPELTLEERREAARALKGAMLRREVYALDGTEKVDIPYSVVEQNFTVELLQQRSHNRHAVFCSHPRETVTYHYERNPADPRVQHAMTLAVDEFGNVLKAATIGYGRRSDAPGLALLDARDRVNQTRTVSTFTENDYTNAVGSLDDYRTPMPCESRGYEITGVKPEHGAARFSFDEWTRNDNALALSPNEIPYEQDADHISAQRRLIERVRAVYRTDDLTALLPMGGLESRALAGDSYKLAFTPGLVATVLAPKFDAFGMGPSDVLGAPAAEGGGYVDLDSDGHWWIPSGRVFLSPTTDDPPASELAFARTHFFLPHRYRDPFHTDAISTESVVTYDDYRLLTVETRDALGARITAGERLPNGDIDPAKRGNDYRVLGPVLVMDSNRNRSAVAYDTLGLVAAVAVMGKPEEALGDSLDGLRVDLDQAELDSFHDADDPHRLAPTHLNDATTRYIYDLHRFHRSQRAHPTDPTQWKPPYTASLTRETHASEPIPAQGLKVQVQFSFSDGFGREIQHKIQAEPGPVPERTPDGHIVVGPDGRPVMTAGDVSPRWVGSGWTVFNNKGNPVRQYEPFFTDTHRFEVDVRIGVSRALCYDPVARVVAMLHPNHMWEKVVASPWRQENWDVNDTVLIEDPRTDADVGHFFRGLPDDDYFPTWFERRASGVLGAEEQAAATKAAVHAGTPDIAHFDALGRPFLTVAHNRFDRAGILVEEHYANRLELDVEGNPRAVRDPIAQNGDAAGRILARYDYNMVGYRIHQASMESGERWALNDAVGNPLYRWDSRDHQARNAYDQLRRPSRSLLKAGGAQEIVLGRSVYGDTMPDPELNNLRGRLVELYDQSGVLVTDHFDFKGNLLRNGRRLAREYKTAINWAGTVALEPESFVGAISYDALDRPIQLITPHSDQPGSKLNVVAPTYNDANLLEQLHAWLGQDAEPPGLLEPATASLRAISTIDYDAKGQRTLIEYGNGVSTTYSHDPDTVRLTNIRTVRRSDNATLQDLTYTYDPAGNITHIRDDAQQTVFFKNRRVEPSADYTYDSVYRLIEATGREHLGQVGGAPTPYSSDDFPRVGLAHRGDGNAMGNYLERYVYDAADNFLSMTHMSSDPAMPGWTSSYTYDEPSLLEPGKRSNRLTSVTTGGLTLPYTYDAHGNTTRMPHLDTMAWDHLDLLQTTSRQVVTSGTPETTHYVYDSGGRRVRKVTERQNGTRRQERIYLGAFEVFRRYDGAGASIDLERQTLHLMDDKQRVAMVETRTANAIGDPAPPQLVRYQYVNHLGSACLELDEVAQIVSYEEYSPYGSTTYQAVRSQTETPKRYRYTGMERDEESGLNYHGARYYTPWLGRWVSCDPVGIEGGFNVYGYSRNNPIQFIDPTGREPDPWNQGNTDTIAPPSQTGEDLNSPNPHPEMKWENGSWYYTDENWNRMIYVPWEQYEWKAGWAQIEGTNKWVVVGEWQKVPTGTWITLTTEEINVTGTAPKEEKSPWYKRALWGAAKLAVELWSPTGKAKWLKFGAQVAMEWYEGGSLWDAFTGVTIQGVKKKGIDTAAKALGGILADYLEGKRRIPTGTNLALGLTYELTGPGSPLEKFAASENAVTAFGAYDNNYIGNILAPYVFKGKFAEVAETFISNGGRLKFDLTGILRNTEGMTTFELRTILQSDRLEKATDFFLNGDRLTGAALQSTLAHWRQKP